MEIKCHFGPGRLEVPVVLSNGSCCMGLELWGNSGLKLETTGLYHYIQAHCSLTSLSTVSEPLLPFFGKTAEILHFENPHVVIPMPNDMVIFKCLMFLLRTRKVRLTKNQV